jgi:basic membrane protein A
MKQKLKIVLLLFLLILTNCKKESDFEIFNPDFEVFVLLPAEGLGDRSFVDIVYEGVETALIDFNFKVDYIIPENLEKANEWIKNLPQLEGTSNLPTLVIIAGAQYVDYFKALKGDFGTHKVLFINGSFKDEEKEGLASITYHTYAPSYIGGYLSAQLKPGCRALVIEGFDAPFFSEYVMGFKQGVIDAGGIVNDPVFLSTDFSGFAMPDSAYRLTTNLLSENDLVFAMSAGSNLGIINAARDYTQQRYVIGIDSDQSWMGLSVVTGSVIMLLGLDIYEYIDQFSHGNFDSGNYIRTMEDGKTSFLINNLVLGGGGIPDELLKTAIEKEKQITN